MDPERSLVGQSQYIEDLLIPGSLAMGVVRSFEAHARVVNVDTTPAMGVDGIVDTFSATDIQNHLKPLLLRTGEIGCDPFLQYPLAQGKVRYVGEALAVVVGRSVEAVEDAIPLVGLDLEPLSVHVVTGDEGLVLEDPLFDEAPDNIATRFDVDVGDVARAFDRANHVIEGSFETGRHTGSPIDPGGVIASWDRRTESLSVYGATKVPHANRRLLAYLLDVPHDRIRMHGTATGGGFGTRGELYPEDVLACITSMRLGEPVRWIPTRREHLLSFNHSREQSWRVGFAFASDGRILGVDAQVSNDTGAYIRHVGTVVARRSVEHFLGPYDIENYRCRLLCCMTNKTPAGPYRSPGNFEATFVRERLLDIAADELGIDPVELRRINLVTHDQMPHDTGIRLGGNEVIYDSGDFSEPFEVVASWLAETKEKQATTNSADGVSRSGAGIAAFVDRAGFGPPEVARLTVDESGTVQIWTGAPSLGQGHETSMARVVMDVLGIPEDRIEVMGIDTAKLADGGGTFASRGAVVLAPAVHAAARELKRRFQEIGGESDDTEVSPFEETDSRRWDLLVRRARSEGLDLVAEASFKPEGETYSYGVLGVEVAVDVESGDVSIKSTILAVDVGRVIDRDVVEGQLRGALVQGIGGTLLEEIRYDETGQPLVTSFMNYAIPSSMNVPTVSQLVVLENHPSPKTPIGAKGAGELGIVGAGAAISNAIADALGQKIGKSICELPIRREKILAAAKAHG